MERRDLFRGALAAGLFAAPQLPSHINPSADIVIERAVSGTPHQGKTLAVITPHLDDGPFFACGTVAKLLREGYTGYFIRTSNDEKDSYDLTLGETVLGNERDAKAFLQASGLKQMFDLELSQPSHGRPGPHRNTRPADISVSPAEDRYRLQLRPLGTLRRESGSLRDRSGSRSSLLDVRRASGYAGTLRCRVESRTVCQRNIISPEARSL